MCAIFINSSNIYRVHYVLGTVFLTGDWAVNERKGTKIKQDKLVSYMKWNWYTLGMKIK